jgi:hypothetical protein
MMPFDDAITFMQKMAQDSSDSALTFLKLMYNAGYKIILTEFGRQVTEEDKTITLAVGQYAIQAPPDCNWPKTLTLIDGTTQEPLTRVDSEDQWKLMRSGSQQGRPTHYHYKPRFGVGGGIIQIYPASSSASYQLELVYEANDKDLSQSAASGGSIAITNGDSAVVGTTTAFTSGMLGRYLIPLAANADRLPYRISDYTDATHITLENDYQGGSNLSGSAYRIVEIPNLPDDMQILPCYFALEQHWSAKGNGTKQKEFQDKWLIGMARAKKTHATVTRGGIINPGGYGSPFPSAPPNFPTALVS